MVATRSQRNVPLVGGLPPVRQTSQRAAARRFRRVSRLAGRAQWDARWHLAAVQGLQTLADNRLLQIQNLQAQLATAYGEVAVNASARAQLEEERQLLQNTIQWRLGQAQQLETERDEALLEARNYRLQLQRVQDVLGRANAQAFMDEPDTDPDTPPVARELFPDGVADEVEDIDATTVTA